MPVTSPRKICYRLVPKAAGIAAPAAATARARAGTAGTAAPTAGTAGTAALTATTATTAEAGEARSAHADEVAAAAAATEAPLRTLNAATFGKVDLFQILVGQVDESCKLLGDFAIGRFHVVFPFLG